MPYHYVEPALDMDIEAYDREVDRLYEKYRFPQRPRWMGDLLPLLHAQEQTHLIALMRKAHITWPGFLDDWRDDRQAK